MNIYEFENFLHEHADCDEWNLLNKHEGGAAGDPHGAEEFLFLPTSISMPSIPWDGKELPEIKGHDYLAVCRDDLSVSIAWGKEICSYQEEWMRDMDHPETSTLICIDFLLNGNLVYRETGVLFDGGHWLIPYDKEVSNKCSDVFWMLNSFHNKELGTLQGNAMYNNHLDRAQIKIIKDKHWMLNS